MPALNVRMTEDELFTVRERAAAAGLSIGDWVRGMLCGSEPSGRKRHGWDDEPRARTPLGPCEHVEVLMVRGTLRCADCDAVVRPGQRANLESPTS